MEDFPEQPLTDRQLTDDEAERLLQRSSPLHHGKHVTTNMSGAAYRAAHPFVDVLSLDRSRLPKVIREVRCPISLDAELAIAADTGQVSPSRERELTAHSVGISPPHVIDSESELSSFLHAVHRQQDEAAPFALAEVGLTWYSQGFSHDTSTHTRGDPVPLLT